MRQCLHSCPDKSSKARKTRAVFFFACEREGEADADEEVDAEEAEQLVREHAVHRYDEDAERLPGDEHEDALVEEEERCASEHEDGSVLRLCEGSVKVLLRLC